MKQRITGYVFFRLLCIVALWVLLCWFVIKGRGFNGPTCLVVLISGGIVFIPLYKKYLQSDDGRKFK